MAPGPHKCKSQRNICCDLALVDKRTSCYTNKEVMYDFSVKKFTINRYSRKHDNPLTKFIPLNVPKH